MFSQLVCVLRDRVYPSFALRCFPTILRAKSDSKEAAKCSGGVETIGCVAFHIFKVGVLSTAVSTPDWSRLLGILTFYVRAVSVYPRHHPRAD